VGIKDFVQRGKKSQEQRDAEKAKRRAEPPKPNPLLIEAKRVLARKRFGQNFLIHQGTIDGIIRCLDVAPTDTILEVGPGLGFLTRGILPKAKHLNVVELDRRMVDYLDCHFRSHPEREKLTIISKDIMAVDIDSLGMDRFKVVGNLPYNITSGVLFKFAGEMTNRDMHLRSRIDQLTFMVQKEVGERIVAPPGGKDYGPLSIALQYWFDCQLEFFVPPEVFEPRPKVTSVVISLFPRETGRHPVDDLDLMQRLVRASFQQRRKMLRNSLLHDTGLNEAMMLAALAEVGIEPTQRPECVSVEQFAMLSNAVGKQLHDAKLADATL
jgi:16S rRNA (adenine1518-N6/adenine1519-N6)-dimethyltransferase